MHTASFGGFIIAKSLVRLYFNYALFAVFLCNVHKTSEEYQLVSNTARFARGASARKAKSRRAAAARLHGRYLQKGSGGALAHDYIQALRRFVAKPHLPVFKPPRNGYIAHGRFYRAFGAAHISGNGRYAHLAVAGRGRPDA